LWRKTHDAALAEDLTQDTFIILLKNRAKIRDENHLTCFLYRVAGILFAVFVRGEKARQHMEEDLAYAIKEDCRLIADQDAIREEFLNDYRDGPGLRQAFQGLPPRKRRIVNLFFFHGMNTKQIAERLHIIEQTVRNHLSQSMKMLRERLSGGS
jgi:RNA polymerase sigma-70 factor (ECF subfamily)